MSDFNWKNLRTNLAKSAYIQPADDLSTQRGIVAAAIAILDRMSNCERMREVTWKPLRLVAKETAAPAPKPSPKPGDDRGLKIVNPHPLPVMPPSPVHADELTINF